MELELHAGDDDLAAIGQAALPGMAELGRERSRHRARLLPVGRISSIPFTSRNQVEGFVIDDALLEEAPEADLEEIAAAAVARAGYVSDYISGESVRATAEEVEATQVLSRRLVEDYGYPKEHIQTRPQFRVRRSPSDEQKSYPVDIAVFRSEQKTESHLYLVAECKRERRRDGVEQLKRYMDLCPAVIGIWFNGAEHAYVRKVYHDDGTLTYEDLPNVPRHGQHIEDIGLFKRRELEAPSNLKAVFRDIRNHLAGNAKGITRDEALAQEIINLLFCKIHDEINTAADDIVTFRSGIGETPAAVKARIVGLFEAVKHEYGDVLAPTDTIVLDPDSVVYVVGELQNYSILKADRDAVGDAFEVFIGPALRGSEGQFFTPRNVVKMMIDILDPKPGESIIDPACGSGGFLIAALEDVWRELEEQAPAMGWDAGRLEQQRARVATRTFRGLEKDAFLAKVTKAYMAIVGDGRGGVFCENSLEPPSAWSPATQEAIKLGSFDIVLTNPPFGAKIPVQGEDILAQYDLGHKWKRNKASGEFELTSALYDDQPPQILFLERCLQLLKPGGRLGIVLPEAVFGMPTYEYVVTFLEKRTTILGVVSMPEPLFKTSGKGGTHAKVCVLVLKNSPPEAADPTPIFMADVRWCGHDSRGNPTIRHDADGREVLLDEVPLVAERFKQLRGGL